MLGSTEIRIQYRLGDEEAVARGLLLIPLSVMD